MIESCLGAEEIYARLVWHQPLALREKCWRWERRLLRGSFFWLSRLCKRRIKSANVSPRHVFCCYKFNYSTSKTKDFLLTFAIQTSLPSNSSRASELTGWQRICMKTKSKFTSFNFYWSNFLHMWSRAEGNVAVIISSLVISAVFLSSCVYLNNN